MVSDLTFLDMPVEVLAGRPRQDMLLSRLRTLGFRPFPARLGTVSNSLDPLLIDLQSMDQGLSAALSHLSLDAMERLLVILGTSSPVSGNQVIALQSDLQLKSLKRLIMVRRRRQLVDAETALRSEAASNLAHARIEARPRQRLSALYLGDGSASFLALSAALRAGNIDCVPALTSGTAVDFAGSRSFDGVFVRLNKDSAAAHRWLDFVASDTGLSNAPLFLHAETDHDEFDDVVDRVRDSDGVVICDHDRSEAAERIWSHARSAPLRPRELSSATLIDKGTGLFSREFLAAHLKGQMDYTDRHEWPLALLTLRLRAFEDDLIGGVMALSAISNVMQRTLRAIDVPARIERQTLAVSLIGTGYAGAVDLSNRLNKALLAAPATRHIAQDLVWRAVERRRYHTPDLLIGSALIGPFSTMQLAA